MELTADGKGLVANAGVVLLRKTADVVGLTGRIAQVFGPGRVERICRGAVLVGAASAIAVGARNLSQVERMLAHHAGTFGSCGSDSTLWRTLDSIDERALKRLSRARARSRRTVWRMLAARPGGFPWLQIGGKRLHGWVVVDLDATVVGCHSRKQHATGTYKGGFGHHHLGGWIANTGETLSILPRPGNAGSNTATDHITVLDEVLTQIPDGGKHSKLLLGIDGAGASHDTIAHLERLGTTRRRVAWMIGWTITSVEEAAIKALPERAWVPYLDQGGAIVAPIHYDDTPGETRSEYGHVAELTGLTKRPGWPTTMRLIVRRVPIAPRDQAAGKITALEKATGWKYAVTATNINRMRGIPGTNQPQWLDVLHRHHAVVEDHVRAAKTTGLGLLPSASWRINTAWILLTGIARDLDVWTRLLAFHDHPLLATAEPATMRELVYRLPARLAHHARKSWLRFDRDHPNTDAITTAWQRLSALPTVT
ncbi:IS1380 family transposase [Promicromonospora sp. NPDC090134]|uniref:IS1380 family transposase n=1 Tax=Promicromonospora sp. NPDC090134 TaxID=3364408 RepID=UPI0038023B72